MSLRNSLQKLVSQILLNKCDSCRLKMIFLTNPAHVNISMIYSTACQGMGSVLVSLGIKNGYWKMLRKSRSRTRWSSGVPQEVNEDENPGKLKVGDRVIINSVIEDAKPGTLKYIGKLDFAEGMLKNLSYGLLI